MDMTKKWGSAVLFAIVVLALGGCGKDDTEEGANPATQPAITNFNEILQTADRLSLVGRNVNVDNVPVDGVVGTYVFWAGENHSAVPIFRKDRLEGRATEPVRGGNKVRLNGIIRLVENVPVADPLFDRVNEQEKQDILAAKIFISAENVQIIK